jgi:hypothetical protein
MYELKAENKTSEIFPDNLQNRSRQLVESFLTTRRIVLDNSPNRSRKLPESF